MSSAAKPVVKIRCQCGRNLAWVYRSEHDQGRDLIGDVRPRPGVNWTETPGPFMRPGGLSASGWEATCPECGAHVEVSARAVIDMASGILTVGPRQ